MATKLWAMIVMFFITFMTSSAQVLWKLGSERLSFDLLSLLTNWQLIIGIGLYAIAGTLMILSFRGGDVSVLYPIVATSYIWVSFLSIWFLGETMNIFKWVGVSVIFLGIAFIGYGSNKHKIPQGAGLV